MLALCFICRAHACGSLTFASADEATTLALTDLAIRSEMHTENQRQKMQIYFESRQSLNLVTTERIATDENPIGTSAYATIRSST